MLRCVGSRNKIVPDKMSDMMTTVLDSHHIGTGQCPCPAAYFQAWSLKLTCRTAGELFDDYY